MTEKQRLAACLSLRKKLDAGKPRKVAMLEVRDELKRAGRPCSEPSLYVWCARFGVSTK